MTEARFLLKVKFPLSSPIKHKTFQLAPDMTVKEACAIIGESDNVKPAVGMHCGLYLPGKKKWLDENSPLSLYQDDIANEENVEFKDYKEGEKSGNTILFTLAVFVLGIGVGIAATRLVDP